MATSVATHTEAPAPTVALEVALAGASFVLGAVVAAATGNVAGAETPDRWLALTGGWPLLALAGAVVLDRAPGHPLGRFLGAVGLVPLALAPWALPPSVGPFATWQFDQPVSRLGGLLVVLVGLGVPWVGRDDPPLRARLAGLVAVVGAVLVAAGLTPGWWAVSGGLLATYAVLVRATAADPRDERRRVAWQLVTLVVAGLTTAVGWWASPDTAPVTTGIALVTVGLVAARLVFASGLRPLAEHLLDLSLVLSAAFAALAIGLVVWWTGSVAGLPSPRGSAAFSALATLGAAAVAARSVRRAWIGRRYGDGSLSADDVAVITADLHRQGDPRELLDKAARMVAGASGCTEARLVLGDADPVPGWGSHPLLVAGDLIGVLQVHVGDEGLEPRQDRVVQQLLPTVALVARAVGLAVEADHARRDVTRHRDAERSRVLGDLHDGLGPVLAGMSMRVQASLRTATDPSYLSVLGGLADDLARSRADLRQLVAGITPSALDGGDLTGALERLVQSFHATGDGPRLSLHVSVGELSPDVQVTVYRTVAEGITNALRHAAAGSIAVCVDDSSGGVVAEVADDGHGGPVVPGVGLTSLRGRAESLGGRLEVDQPAVGGTRLRLVLGGAP